MIISTQEEQDYCKLEDTMNPISQSINRMKLYMKFTKLEGLRKMMHYNYFEGPSSFDAYFKSKRRAFSNLGIPKELFYILDVDMIFVEQLSAMAAVSPENRKMIGKARSIVPSSTYCTFHQAALGAIESQHFPVPDVFVAPSFICEETVSLYTFLGEKYNKPVFYVDCPYSTDEDAEIYLAEQIHRLTVDMADYFKISLKQENIEKTFHYSNEARKWWLKYQDLRAIRKSNSTEISFQTILLSTMLYSKYGLKETVDITRICYEELFDKIQNEDGILPDDSPKILWIYLLPYHSSSVVSLFKGLKVNVVADLTSQINWGELDPKDPWRSLARKFMQGFIYGPFDQKMNEVLDLIEKHSVDAVIELCHPGCKPASGLSYLVKGSLKEKSIPHISFEADLIDAENVSIEQIRTRVEAFIEMLKNR